MLQTYYIQLRIEFNNNLNDNKKQGPTMVFPDCSTLATGMGR